MESHNKKDPGLDDRLKNIYIRSYDPLAAEIKDHPDKPLPLLTKSGEEFEYGYWEPREAREGKCMLRTALQFMADHTNDPVNHTPKKIAETYKLDVKDVGKQNFKLFFSFFLWLFFRSIWLTLQLFQRKSWNILESSKSSYRMVKYI